DHADKPDDLDRYLGALAAFRDPALIDRGLELALTPQLRSQDTARYLARFFANGAARDRALAFVVARWTTLAPKLTIFGADTVLVQSISAFCDARTRDEIRQFFTAHPLPAAARTLQQTLEQIDNCSALRASDTPDVEAWLNARPQPH